MYQHLKREIYVPQLKSLISQNIRDCEICLTLKYDRSPQKPPFVLPEIPNRPLDILHTDIYTVNNNYNLTIIDKFSKFAQAYPLTNIYFILVTKAFRTFFCQFGIP